MKKLRLLLLALLLLILSASCGNDSAEYIDAPGILPMDMPREDASYILYDNTVSPTVAAAAEEFANDLEELTGNAFLARETDFAARSISDEGVRFVFMDGSAYSGWSEWFRLLSRPYLYTGYKHFTMSLNSDYVKDSMKSDLAVKGLVPIAAFYTGSNILLTTIHLEDYENFAGDFVDGEDTPVDGSVPTVLMSDSSALRYAAYQQAGAYIEVEADSLYRLADLRNRNAQVAEFSASDPALLNYYQDGIIPVKSFHNANALWLLVNKDYYDNLTPRELANIKEAVAALYPRIDKVWLDDEKNVFESILHDEILSAGFFRTRQMLDKSISAIEPSLSREEADVLDYIRELAMAMKNE